MLYIKASYESGSFSKAATNMFVTPPALSIAIKKEEQRLGLPLFDRTSHPLKLTEAGRIYIDSAYKIERLEQDVNKAIEDITNRNNGTLRIGGTQYVNSFVFPKAIHKFSTLYPSITIDLIEGSSGFISQLLLEGSIDFTLSTHHFDTKKVTSFKAFSDIILLAVPMHFPINQKLSEYQVHYNQIISGEVYKNNIPPVPLLYFKDTPMILLTEENNLNKRSLFFCQDAGFCPHTILMVDQLVTSYHLTCEGIGASFASDLLITDNLPADVVYYKIGHKAATRNFSAITSKQHYVPKSVHIFFDLCMKSVTCSKDRQTV